MNAGGGSAAGAPAFAVRDARPGEADAVRALTLGAYAEYAGVMAPAAWAGLDAAVRAALDAALGGRTPAECVVAKPARYTPSFTSR